MQIVHPKDRSVVEALALSRAVLDVAEERRSGVLAASSVRGPAVILGAMQRAGRVVDMDACVKAGVTVCRRWTTGTAAWMGGTGLVLALALPDVAFIEKDATARTLLNRNVRPLLHGFSRAGAMAHYFGRESISLKRRPAGLLGYDVTRKGGVLIELVVGFDQSIALPTNLTTTDERKVTRFQGKTAASVTDVLPNAHIEPFAVRVIEGFVEYVGTPATPLEMPQDRLDTWTCDPVTNELDPCPKGILPRSLESVPIGYIETGSRKGPAGYCEWIGGDVLAPRWLYEDVMGARGIPNVPIDGAKLDDLVRAVLVF